MIMVIALKVDDLVLAGSDLEAVLWMKKELNKRFETKDLGKAEIFVGLEIDCTRSKNTLAVTQSKYAQAVLKRFKMSTSNPCATRMDQSHHVPKQGTETSAGDRPCSAPYRQAIGCLMFQIVVTGLDIAFAIGKLAQHCPDPLEPHWTCVKRVSDMREFCEIIPLRPGLGGEAEATAREHAARRDAQSKPFGRAREKGVAQWPVMRNRPVVHL